MSLSRFYKTNKSFQKKAVLENTTNATEKPVWKPIVTGQEIPPEPETSDTIESISVADPMAAPIPEPPPAPPLHDPNFNNPPEVAEVTTEEILPEPVIEPLVDVEVIRDNAFTAGVAAGRKQAEEDFENSGQTLLRICNELDQLRETILQNSAGEMRELVLAISEKIIRHSVTEQEETIIATIKDAINLAIKSDAFEIQVNPEDLDAVTARQKEIIDSISGLDNIVLKSDATVERGGCKLESTFCTIDASMTSQIKVIHDSVMTTESLPEYDEGNAPLQPPIDNKRTGTA